MFCTALPFEAVFNLSSSLSEFSGPSSAEGGGTGGAARCGVVDIC